MRIWTPGMITKIIMKMFWNLVNCEYTKYCEYTKDQ